MDVSPQKFNPVEECLIKTISDFGLASKRMKSFDERIIRLWLDTLNSILTNILDVYRVAFTTKNGIMCCQRMSETLDGLTDIIKTIIIQEGLNIGYEAEYINRVVKTCDIGTSVDNDLTCLTEKVFKQHFAPEHPLVFGDVDYDVIMSDINSEKSCLNLSDSCDFLISKNVSCNHCLDVKFSNASTQTDFKCFDHSFKKVHKHSIGIQVEHRQNNMSTDYNMNNEYLCNQNFDELYENTHFYNESCSYQNNIDNTYHDQVSSFPHQYQSLPCSSVPLPGTNVSAPIFLPRMMPTPSSLHHATDHHLSSLPYAITMFSSSQSYVPNSFNPAIAPPQHYIDVPSPRHKESKRCHKKSDVSLLRKTKSSVSKSKDVTRNNPKKENCFDSSTGYLTKMDSLEKVCYVDTTSAQFCFSKIDETSYPSEEPDAAENINDVNNTAVSYFNIGSDLAIESKINNISSIKKPDDKCNFTDSGSILLDVRKNKDDNATCYNEKNISFSPFSKNNNIPSILDKCDSSKIGLFKTQVDPLSTLTDLPSFPLIENHNNKIDETSNATKKMDVKLSFVNVLTAGLKVSSELEKSSVKNSSVVDHPDDVGFNQTQIMKPPNVFELSHFPSLKPSSQPMYFGTTKPTLPCLFGVSASRRNENDVSNLFVSNSSNQSPDSNLHKKPNTMKTKESDKKSMIAGHKTYQLKRNLSFYDLRKHCGRNPKGSYHYLKHSNIPSNNFKEGMTSNSQHLGNKIVGSFNSISKKNKTEEMNHHKKSSMNKRKSVTSEDGWTTVIKLRNPDPWNSRVVMNKKKSGVTLENINARNNSFNEIISSDSSNESSPNLSENLSCQPLYCSSAQLECSSIFFEKDTSINDEFDICHNLKVKENGFSLDIIETASNPSKKEKTPITAAPSQFSIDYSSTSVVDKSIINCTDKVSDLSTVNFSSVNTFHKHSSVANDSEALSEENASSKMIHCQDDSISVPTMSLTDDYKLANCSSCEGNDVSNFFSHLSCWNEVFKPDNDSDDQHDTEEDARKSRELQEEADMLEEKIKDLQLNENEIDIETECEFENDNPENIDPHEIFTEYSHYISQISSWGDQIDEMERFQEMLSSDPDDSIFKFQHGSIEQFKEFVTRHPGKALDLHDKLLGRSKKSNSDEMNEERRKRAEEKRQKILKQKADKMRELLKRVEEVKQAQLQIIEERKCRIDSKLKKAEEKRKLHLKTIKKKAHDEEEKLKEIAFINELEAQIRRHDSLALRKEQLERLQIIMEERQRKADEKAAKEAAVGERKRVIEAERMEKIEKMRQKRREREEIIDKRQQERELERLVTARERAREREERLMAIQAAQIANAEELQKKIKTKQENSARRHEENIQHIKQKAVETAMLRNLMLDDSSSDVSSKNNQINDKRKFPQNPVFEHDELSTSKCQRKKCKKIRARAQRNGAMCFDLLYHTSNDDSDNQSHKLLKSYVETIRNIYDNSVVSSETNLFKLSKQLQKISNAIMANQPESKQIFNLTNGLEEILKIMNHLLLPDFFSKAGSYKCLEIIIDLLKKVCKDDTLSIVCFITSVHTFDFLDKVSILFCMSLNLPRESHHQSIIQICALFLSFLEMILSSSIMKIVDDDLSIHSEKIKDFSIYLKDFVNYILLSGFLKNAGLVIKYASVEPIESKDNAIMIESIVSFISCLIHPQVFCKDIEEFFVTTDLVGTVSLLYGHLHQAQQLIPPFTLSIIKFFKTLASEQRHLFQEILGSDGISLQFRYIAGFILQYCSVLERCTIYTELLNYTILVIGYFALKNHENQLILRSGQAPTVLQQLIALPIQYFCDTRLKSVLFPTLVAMCDDNAMCRESLENEMNYSHIESFLEDPISANTELITVMKKIDDLKLNQK